MLKKIVIIAALLAVAAGGFVYWQRTHAVPAVDPDAAGTSTVTRGPLIESVVSTGTVASNLDVPIKVQASGVITQLGPADRTKMFDVGDTVKAGDLLIAIDPVDEKRLYDEANARVQISEAQLEEARLTLVVAQEQLAQAKQTANANLQSAEAALADDQAKAARRKELLAQKLDTQEDYDTAADTAAQAQATLENAKVAVEQLETQAHMVDIKAQDVSLAAAQLNSDKVALDEAKQQWDYCTVFAPMDGVITTLSIQKGTIISSSVSVVGGTAGMVLSDLSHIFILADVDESEIGAVKKDQDVDIKADSYPGVHFSGKVFRIAPQGVNTSNVVTFEVKIEVTSKNKNLLLPQMTADVNIIQQRKQDVLQVPISAVQRKDKKQVVTIQNADGTTKEQEVALGITDGADYEVLSGLNEGDNVVLYRGAGDSRWNGPNPGGRGGGGLGGGRGR
jgi:HlyD family secretion protein